MSSPTATPNRPPARSTLRQPQRQRGRERVAALQDAAAALFLEKGIEATTMTEIAARAGAAIGSLYQFFPTKPALVEAMTTDLAAQFSQHLHALRASTAGRSGVAIADALFDALRGFVAAHPVYATLVELARDETWLRTVRADRQHQIEALFAAATPALEPGRARLLSILVPQLLAIPLKTPGLAPADREALLTELRTMLHAYLSA